MTCANDWRVEFCDLRTGRRKGWLDTTGLGFRQSLNEVGDATISVPVRSVTMDDVWPRKTSVAVTRISGPGASPQEPVCEYLGMVEDLRASSGGGLEIGTKSIEQYLQYILAPTVTYTNVDQNDIAARLVNVQQTRNGAGLLIFGTFETSAVKRDRSYLESDDKPVLEAVLDLTAVINGPDYELSHSLANGQWGTAILFKDYVGNTTPVPLNARLGVSTYELSVSGADQANYIIGRGDPAGGAVRSIADGITSFGGSIYPRFEKSVSWSDVTLLPTLNQHTQGELLNNRHPRAVPGVTLAGTDLAARYSLGDTVDLTMDHGALQYRGLARVVGKSWSSSAEAPTTCELEMVPITEPDESILGVTPGEVC